MVEAGKRARQAFRYFWRELAWERRRIVPGLDLSTVKITFRDPPEVAAQNPGGLEAEHMWVIDVDFDGKAISGTLINSPQSLQTFHEGQSIRVPAQQLCDWMYVQLGQVFGGFTVDKMRQRMSKSERKQHDNAWGFDFGDPGLVDLVPASYLDEKSPKKKGLFGRFGATKQEPQDYARVAQKEHPMSVNMRGSLDEQLTSTPDLLEHSDEKGFAFLHDLALAGSYDGVDVCVQHGADVHRKAKNGMTPGHLAKMFGWQRVMKQLQSSAGR